jgi:hypothetical protein
MIRNGTVMLSAKLTKLLAWECKVRSNKLLAWSAKCSSIIQSYHIKALTPGMEFKSELFHPTKIKIELTPTHSLYII